MKRMLTDLVQSATARFRRTGQKEPKDRGRDDDSMRIVVADIFPEIGISASELIRISAGLVLNSECQDLAKALLARSTDMLVTPMSFDDVQYIPQQVFIGTSELGEFWFGYANYFQSEGIEIEPSLVNMMRLHFADNKETFLVAVDRAIIGLISLRQL